MIPTLQTFSLALLTPDLSLKSLCDAQVRTDRNGLPRLRRTSRFAEAEIEWRGGHYLLSMPLTSAALPRIERTASQLRRLTAPWLTRYRILPGEMRWCDSSGEQHATDLVLEELPAGRDFAEALVTEEKSTLLAALDELEAAMRELGLSHNNLKAANLRWAGGRLIPLRYHDAAIGPQSDADAAAFESLRREIEQGTAEPQMLSDAAAAYSPLPSFPGHRWVGNIFEGLVAVEDAGGYGFVDLNNRPVIPSQYLWVGEFHEGRAEVETADGMGLIDREGNYIIPPEYEIVDYDPATSVASVRLGGRWALFDHLGRRLTEFGMKDGFDRQGIAPQAPEETSEQLNER